MASFSPSEMAFTGFRVVREHPKALIGWAAVQFVLSLSTMTTLTVMAGPALAHLPDNADLLNPDPKLILPLIRQLLPAYLVALAIMLAIYPVLYGAMNRAVLRPQDDRFGYLRLGRDELRQLGLMLAMLGLGLAGYLAAVILGAIVIAALRGVVGAADPTGGDLSAAVLFGLILAGVIYVSARLSLASALTFATRRIDLFGSWALTRGLTLPIFGVFCLAAATSIVVAVLGMVIVAALMSLVIGGVQGLPAVLGPDTVSLTALLSPRELIYYALTAVLNALIMPLLMTPPAAIYQALSGASARPRPAGGVLA